MLQRLRHAVGWGISPTSTEQIRIYFQVYAKLEHGEMLYVIGDSGPLGNSTEYFPNVILNSLESCNSNEGIKLVTTPELYPIWFNAEPVILLNVTKLKYRYVLCSGGKFQRYEITKNNQPRTIYIKQNDMTIQDYFDAATNPLSPTQQEGIVDFGKLVPRSITTGEAFVDRHVLIGSPPPEKMLEKTKFTDINDLDICMPDLKELDETSDASYEQNYEKSPEKNMSPEKLNNTEKKILNDKSTYMKNLGKKSKNISAQQKVPSTPKGTIHRDSISMESTDGVIIVAYRLPVLVTKNTKTGKYNVEWDDDNFLCPSGLLRKNNHPKYAGPASSNTPIQSPHISSPKTGIPPTSNNDGVSLPVAMRLTWIGTLQTSESIPKEDEEIIAKILTKYHCVPLFLDISLAEVYHRYCYGTLWPIFHNSVDVYGKLPTLWWNPTSLKYAWSTYTNVNRMFVNKIIEVYNPGDLIWVQGLHLLVSPSFLSRRLPNVFVGLFLHTPFPSSEIFRTLSVREDILRGMLSASHIGFHLYEYARHFLTCCRRILGLSFSAQKGGYIGVDYNGRMVAVSISHIGIEPSYVENVALSEEIVNEKIIIEQKYKLTNNIANDKINQEKKLIIGIDKITKWKGIPIKLKAFEEFLSLYPEWINKVHLIQVGIIHTTVEAKPSEEKLAIQEKVKRLINRINDRFQPLTSTNTPLATYIEVSGTDLRYRVPLWLSADIYLNTSIRDAVNTFPFEFIYANGLINKSVVVVMSEFSGSSRVLTGSLGVNPWKKTEVVDAIHSALSIPTKEKIARHQKDYEYVSTNTRTLWAERVLIDLKKAGKYSIDGECMGYGLGLSYRMLEFNIGFRQLSIEEIAKSYRISGKRVILLDYGNTLVNEQDKSTNDFSKYLSHQSCTSAPLQTNSSRLVDKKEPYSTSSVSSVPYIGRGSSTLSTESYDRPLPSAPTEVLELLRKLCNDPRNTVFILSGKEQNELEHLVGGVPGLGLAAEHGYFYKWGETLNDHKVSNEEEDGWLCSKESFDDSWKDLAHGVMDVYTQRTHGTYIELKGSAVLWQFRDADLEFGQLQAKELHDQLTQVLEHFPVEVLMGTDYLEVRPAGVDKGVMVDRIISTIERKTSIDTIERGLQQGPTSNVDFILCIGDDLSDEFMFSYLEEAYNAQAPGLNNIISDPKSLQDPDKQVKKEGISISSDLKIGIRDAPSVPKSKSQRKLFTVTVGKKPSAAKFYLNSVDDTLELLHSLAKVSTKANRNLSLNDLRNHELYYKPKIKDIKHDFFSEQNGQELYDNALDEQMNCMQNFRRNKINKMSMSMTSLPSLKTSVGVETRATFEQYFNNIEEEEEEEGHGGIFF